MSEKSENEIVEQFHKLYHSNRGRTFWKYMYLANKENYLTNLNC